MLTAVTGMDVQFITPEPGQNSATGMCISKILLRLLAGKWSGYGSTKFLLAISQKYRTLSFKRAGAANGQSNAFGFT